MIIRSTIALLVAASPLRAQTVGVVAPHPSPLFVRSAASSAAVRVAVDSVTTEDRLASGVFWGIIGAGVGAVVSFAFEGDSDGFGPDAGRFMLGVGALGAIAGFVREGRPSDD